MGEYRVVLGRLLKSFLVEGQVYLLTGARFNRIESVTQHNEVFSELVRQRMVQGRASHEFEDKEACRTIGMCVGQSLAGRSILHGELPFLSLEVSLQQGQP